MLHQMTYYVGILPLKPGTIWRHMGGLQLHSTEPQGRSMSPHKLCHVLYIYIAVLYYAAAKFQHFSG